jgi:hypothetical protein
MTRTLTPPRLASGVSDLSASNLSLRVVWPILDDSMFDREAMREAARQWPGFVEVHGVRLVGPPEMRVAWLDDVQRHAFGVDRAVVCVAPVVKRPPQLGGDT